LKILVSKYGGYVKWVMQIIEKNLNSIY
jgi:hypothetical protein